MIINNYNIKKNIYFNKIKFKFIFNNKKNHNN